MAYMNQKRKAALVPGIKQVCTKYGVKATISVRDHSTLVLTLKSGPIDFIGNFMESTCRDDQAVPEYIQVNEYWYHDHFSGPARNFLKEIIEAMNVGNHDNSDIATDYFDVGWYTDINIGSYRSPYLHVK